MLVPGHPVGKDFKVAPSVVEWLEGFDFILSQTPNLKVDGLIPHVITPANLDIHLCV